MKPLQLTRVHSTQQGFSLIELMIALLLGSFLLLGVTKVLEANMQSSRLQQSYGRIQESGRIAIEMLQRDIRNADYWGCPSELKLKENGGTISNNLENGSTDIQDLLAGGGINGVDNANGEVVATKAVKDGTDIIHLRGSESTPGLNIVKTPNTNAAALLVNGGTAIDVCTVLLVTNCKTGDLFQRTSNAQANVINHNTGFSCPASSGATGNASKDFESKYGPDAKILKPWMTTYFIAESSNFATDGSYSLWRSYNGAAQELVPGIEDLQILYGEDTIPTDQERVVGVYNNATDITNRLAWDNVINVRAYLTVAGDTITLDNDYDLEDINGVDQTYTDKRLRKIFATTGNIRNRTYK